MTLSDFIMLAHTYYPTLETVGYEEQPEEEVAIQGFWKVLWRLITHRPITELRKQSNLVVFYILETEHCEEAAAELHEAIGYHQAAGMIVQVRFIQWLDTPRWKQ